MHERKANHINTSIASSRLIPTFQVLLSNMAEEDVKLYGSWRSPFSHRVEIALKLKGVQHKYYEEDLNNKSPSLVKYNPVHKKIPVLVHGEKAIVESHVILEYIDETWKGYDILPKDPCEKAKARFWARFIDEKV